MTCKHVQRRPQKLNGLERKFQMTNLIRKGRLQFFFHCPQSTLPIRDVIGKNKTEPHIEKNAENFCVECYQNNIVGFLRSRAKYLFLFTKCKSKKPALREYRGERFIVGYIAKDRWLWRGSHYAVQGFTKMVPFQRAFPLVKFGPRVRHWRMKRLNERQTSLVLEHLACTKNIRTACIREIERLRTP